MTLLRTEKHDFFPVVCGINYGKVVFFCKYICLSILQFDVFIIPQKIDEWKCSENGRLFIVFIITVIGYNNKFTRHWAWRTSRFKTSFVRRQPENSCCDTHVTPLFERKKVSRFALQNHGTIEINKSHTYEWLIWQ